MTCEERGMNGGIGWLQSDVNTDEEEAGLYKVQELMNELLGERNCEERGTGNGWKGDRKQWNTSQARTQGGEDQSGFKQLRRRHPAHDRGHGTDPFLCHGLCHGSRTGRLAVDR